MTLIVQSAEEPCRIPTAFDMAADKGITGLKWAIAYITKEGSQQLLTRLRRHLTTRWDAIPKVIVTSCDYGITEPEAIDDLLALKNCRVMLASSDVLKRKGLRPKSAFHPKYYLFDSDPGMIAIVGSANLTLRAFTSNSEAVSVTWSAKAGPSWEAAWNALTAGAVDFSPELLAQYREIRSNIRLPIDIDPPPSPPPAIRNKLPVFLESVQAGILAPETFDYLWIEGGAMSSSASHNQLELPRGCNRFFGFAFNNYDTQQEDIGTPVILVNGHPFDNRKLAWHGDNGMERIYLPTKHQSGLAYPWHLILFHRTTSGYDLKIFPWEGAQAIACRAQSHRLGRTYQLGTTSPRICGLY